MICLYSRRYNSELGFSTTEDCCSLTTKLEYVAVVEANKEMIWLQSFLKELSKKHEDNVLYFES